MIKYFTLATQDNAINLRFRVVEGGYQEQITKNGDIERAINGALDVKVAKPLEARSYMVRVAHTEYDGSPYGTREDLRNLFKIINPTDTDKPNVFDMTDHFGDEYQVYLWGEMLGQPLSVIIEGEEAYFIYQLQVLIIP